MKLIVLLIGSLLCWHALSLSRFIREIEDDKMCTACTKKKSCFARRKLGSCNMVDQWMLVSFLMIRNDCPVIEKERFGKRVFCVVFAAFLSVFLFWSKGMDAMAMVYGLTAISLFFLSVVDWNTQYIPLECTVIILLCGLIHLFADFSNWYEYVIGLIAVSGFLLLVDKISTPILSKKYGEEDVSSGIGDGDIKLMAATGLLLGWKLNFLALGIGCISGSVIHLIRMKIKGSGGVLALGPYLSLGVYFTMICGEQLISWYLDMLGLRPF